jgi:Polyketide cyclase / dehydrase and lipid transport
LAITCESRYIGVSIDRPPDEVYAFASKPENLAKWATGLGESIQQVDGEWIAESPIGSVRIEFTEPNALGVLDHDVILESGERVHNAIRVVPNGEGSEVIFILFRRADVSAEKFAEDAAWVQKDLGILKALLEGGGSDAG